MEVASELAGGDIGGEARRARRGSAALAYNTTRTTKKHDFNRGKDEDADAQLCDRTFAARWTTDPPAAVAPPRRRRDARTRSRPPPPDKGTREIHSLILIVHHLSACLFAVRLLCRARVALAQAVLFTHTHTQLSQST